MYPFTRLSADFRHWLNFYARGIRLQENTSGLHCTRPPRFVGSLLADFSRKNAKTSVNDSFQQHRLIETPKTPSPG
jgi:hypothetical protein